MQRYFVLPESTESAVHFSKDDRHHIERVMRTEPGDRVYGVFPDGRTAVVRFDDSLQAAVESWTEHEPELPADIVVACGLVKGDKLDYIIQKGTELGAAGFVPFEAARSVVKWDEKKGVKKQERWQKIAKEAAEQSHRSRIPVVEQPVSLKGLLVLASSFDHCLFAYEEAAKEGEQSAFAHVVSQLKPGERVLVVTGPEGGFSEQEAKQLEEAGCTPCALGPRILRAETAPLYVLSAVSFQLELNR